MWRLVPTALLHQLCYTIRPRWPTGRQEEQLLLREATTGSGHPERDSSWVREWIRGSNTIRAVYQSLQRYTFSTPFCFEKFQRGSKTWVGFSRIVLGRDVVDIRSGISGNNKCMKKGLTPTLLSLRKKILLPADWQKNFKLIWKSAIHSYTAGGSTHALGCVSSSIIVSTEAKHANTFLTHSFHS